MIERSASSRPFVGRARELAELQEALGEAGAGRGGLVVVTGEPGIGKTRLLQELSERARGDFAVLSGRCWEEGGAPAYWPWIQVVRSAGSDFEAVATGGGGTGHERDPESVRFALFDGVTRFLIDRPGPLLIVLEDLHAADEPSLLLLRFLGEASGGSRILVVCSYRDGEPRVRELGRHLSGLARVGRRIALRGLSPEEVEDYVACVVGESAARSLAPRLAATTGGNPFFLGEL